MERDQAVEQFFFEHFVNKYIQTIKDHGWDIQEDTLRTYRLILEAVMALSVHPTPTNKLRAELMVIISCVLVQLKELNVEGSEDHLSEDKRLEICHDIKTLQTAVQDIIPYIPSLEVRAICGKCLLQIEALCEQDISQPGVDLDLTALNELWSLLRELVLQASKFIESSSECSCQLQRKMNGEKTGERLSRLSDLQEIMGKAVGETDDLQEIKALEEKCKRIKMRRQYSKDTSRERITHGLKQMENSSLTSTPKKLSVVSAQGTNKIQITTESDSGSESGDENRADKQKYPVLANVHPRWSLLHFGEARKPPSHMRGKRGKWLLNEEEDFIVKTLEIGEGKWAEIKDAMKSTRSSVQLKDKWRQITLSRITKVARQYGLTYKGSKKSHKQA